MKFFIILLIFCLMGCTGQEVRKEIATEPVQETETTVFYERIDTKNLSKKKKSWGMRRNPPDRPQFTEEQKEEMDKYGCIYLGAEEEKYLYLTFDEGYENNQTGKILDILKEKNVPATFFITGDYLENEKALVDRMVEEGHIVGNHTMKHPCVAEIKEEEKIEEELLSLDRAFYSCYNKHMKYFRPPEGAYSEFSLAVSRNMGYINVFWSFAYDDWYTDKQRGSEYAYNKVVENLHPGEVLLLHAVSEDNCNALGDIIDTAREMGYEFKSLDSYIP